MVKTTTFQKRTWWKNDDANGGAMKQAINECPAENRVVKSWTTKHGQMWSHMSPEALVKQIEKNHGIYEVITQFPHKLYFDIDRHLDGSETDTATYLDDCLRNIKTYFPVGEFAVSGSITDKKQSYHIISDSYVIHNKDERDIVKIIVKKLGFDAKVYGSNQNMKCINQSKQDGRVQEIIQGDNFKSHIITAFLTDYPTPIQFEREDIVEEIQIAKAHKTFDIGILPKLLIPTPDDIQWDTITPLEVLGLLPCTKDHSFEYAHKVARFCFTNGIGIEQFLSWIQQKREVMTNEFITKWNYHFQQLHKFPACSFESMKPILAYYYPDIKKDIHLRRFKTLMEWPTDVDKIKISRLEQKHFYKDIPADKINPDGSVPLKYKYNPRAKASILSLGMGSGKTAQTIDYLKTHPEFCWIGHRRSLHKNTLQRIKEAGINCVDYQTGTTKTKSTIYNDTNALAICSGSLHYLQKDFTLVVIDEIESLFDSFIGEFQKDTKHKGFETLCRLVKNADKVILLDAFITKRTINFLRAIDSEMSMEIIYNEVSINKTIIFHNSVKDCKEDDWDEVEDTKKVSIDKICKQLIDGKKIFLFYPLKTDMEAVVEVIKQITGKRIIFYNADVDDSIKNTLDDVNKCWSDYDCVITNQVITCGVNFDLEGFDHVWMFLMGFVKPREAIQVSARIRKLKENTINVSFLGSLKNKNCYVDDTKEMNNPIYSVLYNDSLIEDKSPRRKTFEIFCSKAGYKMKKKDMRINKEICAEMDKLFDSVDVGFSYETIDDIDCGCAEIIENKTMSQTATMYDKLCLQKYYFKRQYSDNADNETMSIAWNEKFVGFLEKLKAVMRDDSHLFKKIQIENKWDSVFPSEGKMKPVKISKELIDEIFTNYKFRTLTASSSKNQIYREIINTDFNKLVITTKHDGKNIEWYVADEILENLERFTDLVTNHSV